MVETTIRLLKKQKKLEQRKRTLYFGEDISTPKTLEQILQELNGAPWGTYFKSPKGNLFKQRTGSYRSADDIWLLCKSYGVEISFPKLVHILKNTFRTWWCPDVNKRVYNISNPYEKYTIKNSVNYYSNDYDAKYEELEKRLSNSN